MLYTIVIDESTYIEDSNMLKLNLEQAEEKVKEIIANGINPASSIYIACLEGSDYFIGRDKFGEPMLRPGPMNLNIQN